MSHGAIKETKYVQFPLCALAADTEPKSILLNIIHYSVIRAGATAWDNMEDHIRSGRAESIISDDNNPRGFTGDEDLHFHIVVGGEITGFRAMSIQSAVTGHNIIQRRRNLIEAEHGKDVEVRIRSDILMDAYQGDFKYIHFVVLVAVYSVLGRKNLALITRSKILRRSLGYKSVEAFAADIDHRIANMEPLSVKQIRTALDHIEERGLIVRVQPSRRRVYFSNRLTRQQLVEQVAKIEVERRIAFAKEKSDANAALRESIKQQTKLALSQ